MKKKTLLLTYFILPHISSISLASEITKTNQALIKELAWLQAENCCVEVVSKQKEDKNMAAGIVSIVTQDDIKRYGGNSLFEILNRVPSLYMASSFIWSDGIAAMRGDLFNQANNHTLVLINGRPFRDGLHGGLNETMFRNFPVHHIQRIEVIRGSGSVLYGSNAYSAVINVVTQKNKETELSLHGQYGSYDSGQVETEFAWKNEQVSITGAVRYRLSDGWDFVAKDEVGTESHLHRDNDDLSVSLHGEWQDFNFTTYAVKNDHHHWGVGDNTIKNKRLFVDLGYKKQINNHWLSQWNVTYNYTETEYHLPTFNSDDFNFSSSLSNGLEHSVLFEQTHFFNFFEKKLNFLVGGLVEWQHGRYNQEKVTNPIAPYHHLRTSLYGEIAYNPFDNLKITLGGQWNHFQHLESKPSTIIEEDEAVNGFVGRLGLVYKITSNVGVKLLFSQAFRSPSALELENASFTVSGDRSLKSERIETMDAQVFFHNENYHVTFTAFRSRQSNLIRRDDAPFLNRTFINAGSAVFEGLELETQARLFKSLHWTGSYTFQTNRDSDNHNNATLVPNHMFKIGLSYDVNEDIQLSMFDTFFSQAKIAPEAKDVNPPAKSFHNLSFNGNFRLNKLFGLSSTSATKNISFSLYLDNLLDEKIHYPEFHLKRFNTIPASPGRMVFGEITIDF